MAGNLESKMVLLLVVACGVTVAAAQAVRVECQSDEHCKDGLGYYCEASQCRKCLICEELNRKPSTSPKACITSVGDCGDCIEGLTQDVQGLRCVGTVPPVYVWVLIALGGLLLFGAAVAIVVYVLRNTHTFRVTSARTSLQPGCDGSAATAPELPPPYNTLYSPVRSDSPLAPTLPSHFIEDEAASLFPKCPPQLAPARESAGNQEANVYQNPNYVRGPHLPNNHHAAESAPEPEYLLDENTAESPWRPGDAANNNTTGENSESGSSSAEPAGPGATPLSTQLASARVATLVRPPCLDTATPNKMPRLRQDSNNNRNNRDREEEETVARPSAGGPTINILLNVQQVNDLKL